MLLAAEFGLCWRWCASAHHFVACHCHSSAFSWETITFGDGWLESSSFCSMKRCQMRSTNRFFVKGKQSAAVTRVKMKKKVMQIWYMLTAHRFVDCPGRTWVVIVEEPFFFVCCEECKLLIFHFNFLSNVFHLLLLFVNSQKNPSTIRQPEDDRGRENYTMTGWVSLEGSTPISRHISSLCSEASDSTYMRDADIRTWATLPGKYFPFLSQMNSFASSGIMNFLYFSLLYAAWIE